MSQYIDRCPYFSINPETVARIPNTKIVFSTSPEVILKTKHAGDAVVLAELHEKIGNQGDSTLSGSSDGWCILTILFKPRYSISI